MASDLEPDIKCLLCQDYLCDPTTIPCGHNFCMKCIKRRWDMEVHSGIYTCPRCKRTLTRRPSLSKNMALANMVQQVIHLKRRLSGDDGVKIQTIADTKGRLKKKTKEREENLEKLRAKMVSVEKSAEAALQAIEGFYEKLLRTIENKREEHRKHVKEKKGALLSQAESEEKWLIRQISILRQKGAELDTLGAAEWDKLRHPQIYQNINKILQEEKQLSVVINDYNFLTLVDTDLNDLRATVMKLCDDPSQNIQKKAPEIKPRSKPPDVHKNVNVIKPLPIREVPRKENIGNEEPITRKDEPKAPVSIKTKIMRVQSFALPRPKAVEVKPASLMTREDLLQNACSLKLNHETANPYLLLSEDKIKLTGERQRKQNLPKAFDHWKQVLCVERLFGGRCYWEVDWRGKGVFIGVALEGLCRKGRGLECGLGRNASSWSLLCAESGYSAWHNNDEYEVTVKVSSPRIGVFLDQLEGTLTFYSVAANAVTALHTFTAHNLRGFLFPCFGVEKESSVKLVQLDRN